VEIVRDKNDLFYDAARRRLIDVFEQKALTSTSGSRIGSEGARPVRELPRGRALARRKTRGGEARALPAGGMVDMSMGSLRQAQVWGRPAFEEDGLDSKQFAHLAANRELSASLDLLRQQLRDWT
jgi:hypothetical protein